MGLVTAAALFAAKKSSSSFPSLIIMVLAFVAIFYFIAVRPQRKQRQKHVDLMSTLKKGDEVVTVGGMYGIVKKVGNEYVELEVANRTRVKFLKRAISSIISEEEEEEDVEEATDEVVDVDAEEAEADGGDEAVDSNDEAPAER